MRRLSKKVVQGCPRLSKVVQEGCPSSLMIHEISLTGFYGIGHSIVGLAIELTNKNVLMMMISAWVDKCTWVDPQIC